MPLYKYIDDSTLFEICNRKSESVLKHSVDIAAMWTVHNDMKINSDKSKETLPAISEHITRMRSSIDISSHESPRIGIGELTSVMIANYSSG